MRALLCALLLAAAGCGRIDFDSLGSSTSGDGGGSGDARNSAGDSGAGVDALSITGCGPTTIIDDDFADGTLGSEWTQINTGGYAITESGGALTITYPASAAADSRGGYRQTASMSLVGTCAIAEISVVPAASANSYAYVRFGAPTKYVEIAVQNGMTVARFFTGATAGTNGSAAYSATNHRFLRIKQSGSQNYNFEVAAALTGPYQTLGSAGGALVDPSPTSLEFGGSVQTTAANNAGSVRIERVLLLGP